MTMTNMKTTLFAIITAITITSNAAGQVTSSTLKTCVIQDESGLTTGDCPKEVLDEYRAYRQNKEPATKADINAINARLTCIIELINGQRLAGFMGVACGP